MKRRRRRNVVVPFRRVTRPTNSVAELEAAAVSVRFMTGSESFTKIQQARVRLLEAQAKVMATWLDGRFTYPVCALNSMLRLAPEISSAIAYLDKIEKPKRPPARVIDIRTARRPA